MSDVGVTFASFSALGAPAALTVARQATDLGLRSFWTAEASGMDGVTVLAAVGNAAPRLDLGTGVIPIQLRSPLLTAMTACTLQAFSPERNVLLGVGMSSPVITERWHGVPYLPGGSRPLPLMREYLTIMRSLLAGESVTTEGPIWRLRGAQVGVRLGAQRPKLVLAALNPGMLRLAGELADGVLLNYLPASHVAWSVAHVREAEAAAGRPAGSCRVYAYVHVGVGDREAARDRARKDLWSYAVVEGYARNFERAGYVEEIAEVRRATAARERDAAVAAISERMIDEIDVMGTPEQVRDVVAAYLAGGVDEAVLMPLPWGPDRMAVIADTLEAVAPLVG